MFKKSLMALILGMAMLIAAPATTLAAAAPGEKPALLPDPTARETQLHALWVIIIFVVLLAVLYPTAWKSVLSGLKAREEKIRKDIADAEASRARAEATLREYNQQLATAENKVREMIAAAVAQGEKTSADIRMKAQQEAEEMRNRTLRELDTARKQAVAEIYEKAAELSTGIAAKILRRNINAEDQRDLVRQSLEQMQTVER